jgi:thioredoxin reductase
MKNGSELPVAVIGAGPIGLAAAAHLVERGIPVRVYEAGASVGANLPVWGHVRIFTTCEQNIDSASRRLLERNGWKMQDANALPTGEELYQHYLKPLAELPAIAESVVTHARVVGITRQGLDKVTSKDRETKAFELHVDLGNGRARTELARAVIDASGTWQNPNPLGASGFAAAGEGTYRDHIAYGMPDVLNRERQRYLGKRIAVVGSGYSAINVLLDLVRLCRESAKTQVTWIVRGKNMAKIYGGGENDQLPARGKLGSLLKPLVDQGRIRLVQGFYANTVANGSDALTLSGTTATGAQDIHAIDEIIVATGQRPDLQMTRELRVELDPWLESVKALGPLIDPNVHSCGSVPPHGHRETSHPEPGFYTIGVKSYGRAPTFLLLTGYEQARSVVAAIAGDMQAADDVQLVLPETGICETDFVDEVPCCGSSKTEEPPRQPSERAPIEIVPVAAKSGGCCGPRA